MIDEAINDTKNMLQITLDNEIPDGKGGKKSTDEYCGAAVSPAIPLKKNGKITGEKYVMALDDKYPREDLSYKDIIKGDKLNYDLFDSFIHELFGHAIPAMKHQMGDAIELENVARGRIGKIGRQLEQDPNGKTKHPTIKTENYFFVICYFSDICVPT